MLFLSLDPNASYWWMDLLNYLTVVVGLAFVLVALSIKLIERALPSTSLFLFHSFESNSFDADSKLVLIRLSKLQSFFDRKFRRPLRITDADKFDFGSKIWLWVLLLCISILAYDFSDTVVELIVKVLRARILLFALSFSNIIDYFSLFYNCDGFRNWPMLAIGNAILCARGPFQLPWD